VGPPQYGFYCLADQGPCRRFPPRACLLKGCERLFRPRYPQTRYCSPACQLADRRWRRWRAGQEYRSTEKGKERRREQSRRRRERLRQRAAAELAAAERAASTAAQVPREGQRPATTLEDFLVRPCRRPGCYVLFLVRPRSPGQHFCSCLCRQALRRVLDREAHWQRRHRRHRPQQRPESHPPPNSS
jgi:hypothetical protein